MVMKMKKSGKFVTLVGALLLFVFSLSSCNQAVVNKTLTVNSSIYPEISELESARVDTNMLDKWCYADNPYGPYSVHVDIEKDALKLSVLKYYQKPNTHGVGVNYGYWVGTDFGEFGGYLKFYTDMKSEPTVFSEENCHGIVKVDNDLCYLLSGKVGMSNNLETTIYKLSRPKDSSEWQSEKVATLNGAVQAYLYSKEDNSLYVSTRKALVRVSLTDNAVTTLTAPSYWSDLLTNSMVELDGSLYIGTGMGVWEYEKETGNSYWFPIDYEKYLSE